MTSILSLESHKKVDPAGQKPNTLNPDLSSAMASLGRRCKLTCTDDQVDFEIHRADLLWVQNFV